MCYDIIDLMKRKYTRDDVMIGLILAMEAARTGRDVGRTGSTLGVATRPHLTDF